MVDNKDKNPDDAFDDEEFIDEDFAEADFDDAVYDEDLTDEDTDLADDEWQDEEEQPAKKSKKDKTVQSGEKKGLSFNTIVIIGAVVVGGGVMAMNIMGKTAEVKSSASTRFQSMIDIGGVMDGTLFGDKKEEQDQPADAVARNDEAAPVPQEGFLNNPEAALPPQPVPLMPEETDVVTVPPVDPGPLTPMPGDVSEQAPRGPEETQDLAMVDAASEAQQSPKAEDILKQAMANREQKAQENAEAVKKPAPEIPVAEAPVSAPAPTAADPLAPAVPTETPAPVAQQPANDDTGTKILATLESKIGQVLDRIGGIENGLSDEKKAREADYKRLEQKMASMQDDIDSIRSRPVASAPVAAKETVKDSKPAAPKKKAKRAEQAEEGAFAPKIQPSAPIAAAPSWELRAAQPGRAWVSKRGSRDMQAVVIGENLTGIGRVTGIVYQNGRWTVQGTQGQIFQ